MGDFERSLLNVFEKLAFVSVEIGRNSDKHFIDQNTQEVPVDAPSVARSAQHLRSQVGY